MTTLEELLDGMLFAATSERDKGDRFERFLKSYFKIEPKYADLFSDVWLWQEWPGRQGRPDTGIDLVARDRYTGELVAIQAKFFDPQRKLEKSAIDSFFTELGKDPFTQGMIVSTTDNWSIHAEAALNNQSKPVQRIRVQDLEDSTIDWAIFNPKEPEVMHRLPAKAPRKYQSEAIADVIEGFELHDRGKLIMACGTGKTFTTLKLVEQMVPEGGTVLFLVPSIALLQQTLNEWTAQASLPLRPFAVCSDVKVGRRDNEDVASHDLGYPATTNPQKLRDRFASRSSESSISVVFSTYQSIDVIHQAQELGLPEFDLIICDEAHRTTGISQPDSDDSAFVRVHDDSFLDAKKRLYMTATPRIYVEESKAKAEKDGITVYSMDDLDAYGPEFHHLGFGRAVEMGHLSDYKVLILAVDEESIASSFQDLLAREGDMNLDDVARIVGCWNGLSKRGVNGERLSINDKKPMQRAVAFARNIKESKQIAHQLNVIGRDLLMNAADAHALELTAKHVDGTFNVLERSDRIDWLEAGVDPYECRILTNAKCLTEGVDVPSLDAVLFLNPRNSQVDVVQAVGRVMRKAPDKEYGYIILPIAVPASQNPETALDDNKKYKVVWDVLQALRAHDDRFEAMINKIELDKNANTRIDVIGIGGGGGEGTGANSDENGPAVLFNLANAAEWQNAIFARMVKKVGDRRYWEDWAADVKDIADRQVIRIQTILDGTPVAMEKFDEFLDALKANLNDSITRNDAVDMLVQHLITKPVFDALFEDYAFSEKNPVSRVMDKILNTLESYNLDSETASLEEFYRSVKIRAEGINTAEGKQQIITELYERFFKLAFPRVAESLGIVYTPIEIVDFIIRAVNDALQEHFGATISDEGVHVLDPFTGTGTFIVRLLQSGLIKPEDLLRKFTQELHANEILLMAYYIAAINIEATFHGIERDQAKSQGANPNDVRYEPFNGIVLTDTFQMAEDGDTLDEKIFTSNNERVVEQNALDIRVVMGNPPYSVGQSSGNDDNANLKYPSLDDSIRNSYAARSSATLKNSLYDSYVRAIRWASDRVISSDQGGVVCYVTNNGYIDGNTADGLRRSLRSEFHDIYVLNLRGNSRAAGEVARREGGNVFDIRVGVAILLLVKRPGLVESSNVHYFEFRDGADRGEKLSFLAQKHLETIDWVRIVPNASGDWINQRDPAYESFDALYTKNREPAIFTIHSGGLKTNRDAWVYNFERNAIQGNLKRFFHAYDRALRNSQGITEELRNPRDISWSSGLEARFARGERLREEEISYRKVLYRPFVKQWVAFSSQLNDRQGKLKEIFPETSSQNFGIFLPAPGNSAPPFMVLATDHIVDLGGAGISGVQFLPRFTYSDNDPQVLFEESFQQDNISDWIRDKYESHLGTRITKDQIFSYVYGVLHSPEYRKRFSANLRKQAPRIPVPGGIEMFKDFCAAGSRLLALHLSYEQIEPFPLEWIESPSAPDVDDWVKYRVSKMRYGGKPGAWDKTRIRYNEYLDILGIPPEVQQYTLGGRSALDWIIDRYQLRTDGVSGHTNDPNEWAKSEGNPKYIFDLIGRIVAVSLETNRIVDSLPDLGLK